MVQSLGSILQHLAIVALFTDTVYFPCCVSFCALQEAAHAADRVSGSGSEVTAWSTCAAHMLHVWHSLQTPILAAQFY